MTVKEIQACNFKQATAFAAMAYLGFVKGRGLGAKFLDCTSLQWGPTEYGWVFEYIRNSEVPQNIDIASVKLDDPRLLPARLFLRIFINRDSGEVSLEA